MRICLPMIFSMLVLSAVAGEMAADTGTKKVDWTKPETVQSFFDFMAKKYKWPASVTKTEAAYTVEEKIPALGVLFTAEKPSKDDMVKSTYAAANIIGQAMAQGVPVDRAGVIFKSEDGTAVVTLPPADLKKLGQESIKGAQADKAALNKMVAALIAKCNWKEVEALAAKNAEPKK